MKPHVAIYDELSFKQSLDASVIKLNVYVICFGYNFMILQKVQVINNHQISAAPRNPVHIEYGCQSLMHLLHR